MYQPTKETSKEAYYSIEKPTKTTLHADIMRIVQETTTEGITAGNIGLKLGVVNSTIGARIVELEEALSEGRFISPHSDWHKRATALIS